MRMAKLPYPIDANEIFTTFHSEKKKFLVEINYPAGVCTYTVSCIYVIYVICLIYSFCGFCGFVACYLWSFSGPHIFLIGDGDGKQLLQWLLFWPERYVWGSGSNFCFYFMQIKSGRYHLSIQSVNWRNNLQTINEIALDNNNSHCDTGNDITSSSSYEQNFF